MLQLDAADPPPPDEWVADLDAAGADAAALYAWGPIARYTPAHVAAATAAGKRLLPIVVPGNSPGPVEPMLAAVAALGVTGGPLAFDLEWNSLPSGLWAAQAFSAARLAGYSPRRYGDEAVLATYPPADGDWLSHGPGPIRAGAWKPVPELPSGVLAWQYCVDAVINGRSYDVSVIDPAFWDPPARPARPALEEDPMEFLVWNDTQQLFRVTAGGILRQRWSTGQRDWQSADLATGLQPGVLKVVVAGNQLHLWAVQLDDQVRHLWQSAGGEDWGSELLG